MDFDTPDIVSFDIKYLLTFCTKIAQHLDVK